LSLSDAEWSISAEKWWCCFFLIIIYFEFLHK
jgi:hypothetical protein